jgi:hypothetical protein
MNRCIGEPISWLRLERYGLGEVAAAEQARIAEHLASCAACRACLEHMEQNAPVLRLPLPAAKPRARRTQPAWSRVGAWAAVGAAALAALVLLARKPELSAPGSISGGSKGGELTLELIRSNATGKQLEANRFAAGERWKAQLACPARQSGYAQLVIYQGAAHYQPLDALHVAQCGNHITLPGAFTLSGELAVRICVVLSSEPLEPTRLERESALPEPHVCREVLPAP